jgi:hypothetical protein
MRETATVPAPHSSRPLVVAAAGAAGLLLMATVALWGYYGTAVFYEIIAAGMALCL